MRRRSLRPLCLLVCGGVFGCAGGPKGEAPGGDSAAGDCASLLRYADGDGDGYGTGSQQRACAEDPAFADRGGDCDDADAAVHPGAEERCDGRDEDCDGGADNGPGGGETWYRDADGDGYGDPGQAERRCGDTTGWVREHQDCLDSDPAVHPGAEEVCGDLDDDDCDGLADVGEEGLWYDDTDGDGYGYVGLSQWTCEPPAGWVQDDRDCAPTDAAVNPGAVESCNDRDDNCDGVVDEGMDSDGDGARSLACADGDDCDDSDADVFPGNPIDRCEDGIDGDCDGVDPVCGLSGDHLLSAADAYIYSSKANYRFGLLVDVGDATGDGVPDVLSGTYTADAYAGGGFLLPGPLSGNAAAQTVGYRLSGDARVTYGAGRSIGVADIDGDGVEDLGFGAAYGATPGYYTILGPVTGDRDLSTPDLLIACTTGTYCGHGGDFGDLTGDGVADVLIGAYLEGTGGVYAGAAYVLYGPITGDLSVSADADRVEGVSDADMAGRFVVLGGDINGDGLDEAMVAAPYATGAAGRRSGVVYVSFGPVSLSSFSDADLTLLGAGPSGYLGEGAPMSIGDLDGDGYGDVGVGSCTNAAGSVAGAAWAQFGPVSGALDLNSADLTIEGARSPDHMGAGLSIGDTDADGVSELLVGASADSTGSASGGVAWLFSGLAPGVYGPGDAVASLQSDVSNARAGASVLLDDVNGDGGADAIVGAPYESTGGSYAGAVFLQRSGL